MRSMLTLLIPALALATPAFASDGVLEINQTCAVQTGCFPGDGAGFPVTVSQSGSYGLTSDLVVPSGPNGVQGSVDDVTLDLNGFTMSGAGTGTGGWGVFLSQRKNWEIRNGTIRDFGGPGVGDSTITAEGHRIIGIRVIANGALGITLGGSGHLIEGCTIQDNATFGVAPGSNGLLIGNVIEGNGSFGITFNGTGNGYGKNVINGNASGTVSGSATEISGNVCNGSLTCP